VLGLDPKLEYIPKKLLQQWQIEFSDRDQFIEESLVRFNSSLIESVHDIIPAVKPQIAYYEMYGLPGLKALERTIGLAKENNMLVILDGKRNDIGVQLPPMQLPGSEKPICLSDNMHFGTLMH